MSVVQFTMHIHVLLTRQEWHEVRVLRNYLLISYVYLSDAVILVVIGLVVGVFAVAACRVQRKYKRRQLNILGSLHDSKAGVRYRDLNNDETPLVDDTSEDEFDGQ